MKTLLLARHAKSSWDDPEWRDFDRPLNKRGLRDAPLMAKLVKEKGFLPELIITSPANRALTTARIFAAELNYPESALVVDINVYERGAKYLVQTLSRMDDKYSRVALFGHNPDVTSLVSYFSGAYTVDVPTCGCICIDFEVDSWRKIESVNGSVRFFERPAKH